MHSIKVNVLLQLAIFLFSYEVGQAQNFTVSSQVHYGAFLPNGDRIDHLIKGHVSGVGVNLILPTNGSKVWHQEHNYPEMGINVTHFSFGNKEQLGSLLAVYPFLHLNFKKAKDKHKLYFRLGAGAAYANKTFDRIENHKNILLGSHINLFANLSLGGKFSLTPKLRLDAGIGLSHASNGSFKKPNLGVNAITTNLGLGYSIGSDLVKNKNDSLSAFEKKRYMSFIAVTGMHERSYAERISYFAYGLQTNFYQDITRKSTLGLGLEITYNTATKAIWKGKDSLSNPSLDQLIKIGTNVGYVFRVGKLSMPVDFGVYVFQKEKSKGDIFHRIGFRYVVGEHIIANATLRTHWFRAEYFELGVGYQFN